MGFGGGLQPFAATRRVDLSKSCRKWSPHFLVQTGWSPRVICLVTPIPALQVAIQADFTSLLHLDMPDLSPDWFTFPDLATATAGCRIFQLKQPRSPIFPRPWTWRLAIIWRILRRCSYKFSYVPMTGCGWKVYSKTCICTERKRVFLVHICFYILLLWIYRTFGICPCFMTYLGLDKHTWALWSS